MAFFIPDVAKISILVNWIIPDLAEIHLFQTSVTVDRDITLADLTECTFSGYSAVAPASWATPTIVSGNVAESLGDDCVFTHDGGATSNDVYGAYILDGVGDLVGVELFPGGPFPMAGLADEITVHPIIRLRSIDDN